MELRRRAIALLNLVLARHGCGLEAIDLGCHHEVITMEPADLVRPERDRDPAPLGQDRRMMSLVLRQRADAIREGERLGEIRNARDAFQPLKPVAFQQRPLGNLRLQFVDLRLRHAWRIAAAGGAFFVRQGFHDRLRAREAPQVIGARTALQAPSNQRSPY